MSTWHQVKNAQHAEYVRWVHAQPCAACGYEGEAIQAAHVGVGGVGLKHGDDDKAIPLCGPHLTNWWQVASTTVPGCHADHDQCRGQFRLMTREQRQRWDADQVAIHRARFEGAESAKRTGEIPF